MISLPLPVPVYIRIHGEGRGEGEAGLSGDASRRGADSPSPRASRSHRAYPRRRVIARFSAFQRLELSALRCRCSRISRARRITRRYGRPSLSLSLSLFLSSFSPCLPLFPSATRVSFNSRPLSRELRRTHRKTAYRELQSLIRQKPLRAVNAANRAICILHGTRRGTSIRSRVDASPPAS